MKFSGTGCDSLVAEKGYKGLKVDEWSSDGGGCDF